MELIDRLPKAALTAAIETGLEDGARAAANYPDPETRAFVLVDQAAYVAGLFIRDDLITHLNLAGLTLDEDDMTAAVTPYVRAAIQARGLDTRH